MNLYNVSFDELFTKLFQKIQSTNPDAFGVQIGAFDGVGFDETQPILKSLNFPFLFVEPVPYYFERMKKNLSYNPNNKFDNCAIATTDGSEQMAVFDPLQFYENQPMSKQYCLTGMSSLFPIKNNPWETPTHTQTVTTKTMKTLLADNNVTDYNVFICDTEGYDYKIFQQLQSNIVGNCLFWRFEIQHLEESETRHMIDSFKHTGYTVFAFHDQYPVYSDEWNVYQDHRCHDLTAINTKLLESLQ